MQLYNIVAFSDIDGIIPLSQPGLARNHGAQMLFSRSLDPNAPQQPKYTL